MRTPKQNGIIKRINRSIIEATRAILIENDVSKMFWREAMNIIVYTMNRVQVRKDTNETPCELQFGHSPIVKYFIIFGRKCYIKRGDDVGKFDAKSDEGMFLGYSLKSRAYKCYNLRNKTILKV